MLHVYIKVMYVCDMEKKNKNRYSVTLDPDVRAKAAKKAQEQSRSFSGYIEHLIKADADGKLLISR